MSLKSMVAKYIDSAEHVLRQMQEAGSPTSPSLEDVEKVVNCARDYLRDAKYYRDKGNYEVSLASVAYCEGLLDALKLLGAVKFEWPVRVKQESDR